MDQDGTAGGYDLELLRAVGEETSVPIVASGGVGTLEHMLEGALAGADALLAASIFHYGTFTIGEAKAYLERAGVSLRPIGA
jgi:cyclase